MRLQHTRPFTCTEEFNGTLDNGHGAWEITQDCGNASCASSTAHSAANDKPGR